MNWLITKKAVEEAAESHEDEEEGVFIVPGAHRCPNLTNAKRDSSSSPSSFYSPRLSNHPTHMITCDSEEDTKNFMPPLFCLSSSIALNHLNSSWKN